MFDVLLSGRLVKDPQTRTGASGKPFTTALLICPTEGNASMLASLIGFGEAAARLGRLCKGDAVSVNGRATLRTWEGKDGPRTGLSITVSDVLTAYGVAKRRAGKAFAQAA
jgi:single-stranded DNA-binding protein